MSLLLQKSLKKIHDSVIEDRRLKLRGIAKALGISNDREHNILNEHLGIKKMFARLVP